MFFTDCSFIACFAKYVVFLIITLPSRSTLTNTLFPYTTLFRSLARRAGDEAGQAGTRAVRQAEDRDRRLHRARGDVHGPPEAALDHAVDGQPDQLDRGQARKSTRLNSSH